MDGTPPAEVTVSADLVRALIADQRPEYAHLPVRLAGEGWDNFIFRLGDELALRLPRRKEALACLANEQGWLSRLPPLPVPIPVPVATGEPGRGFPWPWSIIPWIEGAPADQSSLNASQGPALAAFLRSLHTPSPPDAPVNPGRGVRLEVRVRFSECLHRLRSSCYLITPAIDRAWREALAAPVCETPAWLHGDLHAQNVMSKEGVLSGVIDWGDLCGGDPAVDLCSVWGLLDDASARRTALDAYAPDDALLARAKGWAVLFGAVLFENGRIDNPRLAAIGETTLRRLAEDL